VGASIHRLPGPCVAAAADGDTVWCVARDRLVAFDAAGTQRRDAPIGAGVRSLAASGQMLVAVVEPGVIVWLDPESGTATQRRPVGGTPVLVAGGGAVWAVDVGSGRAWRVADAGAVLGPTIVADVDRAAADGERLWWTSKRDAFLREGARTVDLGVPAEGTRWPRRVRRLGVDERREGPASRRRVESRARDRRGGAGGPCSVSRVRFGCPRRR